MTQDSDPRSSVVMRLGLPCSAFLTIAWSGLCSGVGRNGPVPISPTQQHGRWTLGRQHPLSRGEESESNYLNCPGGPESRESQQDCRGQVASCPGSCSSCCQASNFLSSPSAHTLSTFPCLAPYVQTTGHRLGKLSQRHKQRPQASLATTPADEGALWGTSHCHIP